MRIRRFAFAATVCVVGAAALNAQTTRHVQAGATPPGNGTVASPFPTIQADVNAAVSGDTVSVGAGTYHETVQVVGKDVSVVSVAGPTATTIDPVWQGTGLTVWNVGPAARFAGFTIFRGQTAAGYGGAGITSYSASSLFEDMLVTGCNAEANSAMSAGGVGVRFGSPVFRRCRIVGNTGYSEFDGCTGGIVVNDSSPRFENCEIVGNIGGPGAPDCRLGCCSGGLAAGGGISAGAPPTGSPPGLFLGCLIAGNIGGQGHLFSASGVGGGGVRFVNCTIVGNVGGAGSAEWGDPCCFDAAEPGATGGIEVALEVVNCVVRGNVGGAGGQGSVWPSGADGVDQIVPGVPVTFSNVEGGYPGVGNIDEDPAPVNYRPTVATAGVDGGNNLAAPLPATDLDGGVRVRHLVVDMGAFESDFTACRGSVRLATDGVPYPALRVDGADRATTVVMTQPSTIAVSTPPAAPGPAPFALFGYVGAPAPEELLALPFGLGEICFPPAPFATWHPALFTLTDNLFGFGGVLPSGPAPTSFVVPPVGIAASVVVQGVMADPSAPFGFSTTNAVRLTFVP